MLRHAPSLSLRSRAFQAGWWWRPLRDPEGSVRR